jgi:hypothetical protein
MFACLGSGNGVGSMELIAGQDEHYVDGRILEYPIWFAYLLRNPELAAQCSTVFFD